MMIYYFNPIIGLILMILFFNSVISSVIFQSHYRSDFNASYIYANNNTGIFQSHYRSDFNKTDDI